MSHTTEKLQESITEFGMMRCEWIMEIYRSPSTYASFEHFVDMRLHQKCTHVRRTVFLTGEENETLPIDSQVLFRICVILQGTLGTWVLKVLWVFDILVLVWSIIEFFSPAQAKTLGFGILVKNRV
jgi:hypothetical protein